LQVVAAFVTAARALLKVELTHFPKALGFAPLLAYVWANRVVPRVFSASLHVWFAVEGAVGAVPSAIAATGAARAITRAMKINLRMNRTSSGWERVFNPIVPGEINRAPRSRKRNVKEATSITGAKVLTSPSASSELLLSGVDKQKGVLEWSLGNRRT